MSAGSKRADQEALHQKSLDSVMGNKVIWTPETQYRSVSSSSVGTTPSEGHGCEMRFVAISNKADFKILSFPLLTDCGSNKVDYEEPIFLESSSPTPVGQRESRIGLASETTELVFLCSRTFVICFIPFYS